MAILADHLEVPSRTFCLMLFMCWMWIILVILKILRISSKISGLFLSRIFILSFIAMMMCCVRSSAPVLELFSAAPENWQKINQGQIREFIFLYRDMIRFLNQCFADKNAVIFATALEAAPQKNSIILSVLSCDW